MLTPQELAAHGVVMTPLFVGDGCSLLFSIPAGKRIGQHKHKLGHFGTLLVGNALIREGDRIRPLQAPATVFLEADQEHEIEGVTDILWACSWADAQGLIEAEEFAKQVAA